MDRTQLEELEQAVKEHRQPVCTGCGQPLDVVEQYQDTCISWVWNVDSGRYEKSEDDGGAERPFHRSCGYHDWDLVDDSKAARKLGLSF